MCFCFLDGSFPSFGFTYWTVTIKETLLNFGLSIINHIELKRKKKKKKKKKSPFESMSLSASQCSKGCESGWTIYLNESSSPTSGESPRQEEFYSGGTKAKGDEEEEEEEEEENLSMVSDASSGPPFREVEDDCFNESCSSGKRRSKSKSKKKAAKENDNGKGEQQHLNYYYEDTACSPHLKFTEQEKTGSQNFHHDKKSTPAAEKANSGKKGGLKSRKWA